MTSSLFLIMIFMLAVSVVAVFGLRYRAIASLMVLALIVRTGFIFLDYAGIFAIPGSGDDALMFTNRARLWSEEHWGSIFSHFGTSHSYNYSVIGAIIFKVFGFHELILPMMNLVAGMLVVGFTGSLVHKMWGARAAQIAVLIIAIYPFSAFNSAVALREEFSVLAFVIGLHFLVKWLREESILGVYVCLGFFSLATLLHPGWVAAIMGVGVYTLYLLLKAVPLFLRGQQVTKRYFGKLVLSASILVLSIGLASAGGGVSLGKGVSIGTEEADIAAQIESRFAGEATGGSAYPAVIATGSPLTQPWLIPARIAYFLYAPFPWDIKSVRHLLGLVATALYLFLSWRIYRGWGRIRRKEECLALMLILASLIIVFSVGVTNIGTGIRHKSKFLILFLLLAASSFDALKFKLRR